MKGRAVSMKPPFFRESAASSMPPYQVLQLALLLKTANVIQSEAVSFIKCGSCGKSSFIKCGSSSLITFIKCDIILSR